MSNHARGEVTLTVNGKPRPMMLTLGAIAEIEDELQMGIGAIGEVMQEGRLKPMLIVVYWMLKAGGWHELTKDDRLQMKFDLQEAMEAFKAAFQVSGLKKGDDPGNG